MSSPEPRDILNFDQPLNVALFDEICQAFFSGKLNNHVHDVLNQFQQHPLAWKRCPEIFTKSQYEYSKIIALNVLKLCVETQWKILPQQQRLGMKAFLEDLILKVAKDNTSDMTGPFVTKLNEVLIAIVKREWPHHWPNFISRVVAAAKKSEAVCINNIRLLGLLSEAASENVGDLTHNAQKELRSNLHKEFNQVFQLCMFILKDAKNLLLLSETLKTLAKFLKLHWIPLDVIFTSSIMEGLACRFYEAPPFRSFALECMVEIANISPKSLGPNAQECNTKLAQMYLKVLQTTINKYQITDKTNFNRLIQNSTQNRGYIQHLTNFFATMFGKHKEILESRDDNSRHALFLGLQLLLRLTDVDDETIFGVCLEYWERLAKHLQHTLPKTQDENGPYFKTNGSSSGWGRHSSPSHHGSRYQLQHPKYQLYQEILHNLKFVLMRRLPRPKEYLVVQDDYGNVIKERLKDTLSLTFHDTISKTLWILSRVDPKDSRDVISHNLERINANLHNINFNELQSLCWSIGAVAGSMGDQDEKGFLVAVIKILLQLCEKQRTKDAKAIIAACIMYVVRKYPKFLRKHWKFLQTVVRKLVEFLHETHPGVQDMSVETLEEISQKTGEKFLSIQKDDHEPFWAELMRGMHDDMCTDLSAEQTENLFYTWGIVIARQPQSKDGPELVGMLLRMPNEDWKKIVAEAKNNKSTLEQEGTVTKLTHLIRIYKQTARAVGGPFVIQMSHIFNDLLHIYDFYAQTISREIQSNSNNVQHPKVRAMRTVKSECLQLFQTFVAKSAQSDEQRIVESFVPSFLQCVLNDYEKCAPQVREHTCLEACCALIDRYGRNMGQYVQTIFKATFQITLNMLQGSVQSFPDHRKAFFHLLRAVAMRCFDVFKQMTQEQLKLIIQCVMWGIEHIDSTVSETSVKTLGSFLQEIRKDRKIASSFYRQFVHGILEKLITVMTDNLHKQSFPMCCEILRQICLDLQTPEVCDVIYDSANGNYSNNAQYMAQQLSSLFAKRFPNLTEEVTNKFVIGCFEISSQTTNKTISANVRNGDEIHPFLKHCDDLLVFIKQVHHVNTRQ